jgi:NTE family protein
MKIGLVLGAGGVTGSAYLAGALAVIEHDLGWDPRTADVIVGTSAGALVGGLLRSGVPTVDLAAWTVGVELPDDASALLRSFERPELDPVVPREFLRLPRVPNPQAVWSAMRHPRRFDPLRALMTHLADGGRDLSPFVEFLGHGWPADPLYCCAVRRRDGHRVVFGRNDPPADGLAAAVAASCAVPGYFAPVDVDGDLYLDGGIASTTNADALVDAELDLVVTVMPMGSIEDEEGSPRSRPSFERYLRDRVAHKLRAELSGLDAGTASLTLAPGPNVVEHLAGDFMSADLAPTIVREAFFETGDQLRANPLAAMLSGRGQRAA